jgi:hypothetical protein
MPTPIAASRSRSFGATFGATARAAGVWARRTVGARAVCVESS